MALITPQEKHAFDSFLTQMANADGDDHWHYTPPVVLDPEVPQGKEALAKATKDLMSLDGDRWTPNEIPQQHQLLQHQHQHQHQRQQQQFVYSPDPNQQYYPRQQDVFPFLNTQQGYPGQMQHSLSHQPLGQHPNMMVARPMIHSYSSSSVLPQRMGQPPSISVDPHHTFSFNQGESMENESNYHLQYDQRPTSSSSSSTFRDDTPRTVMNDHLLYPQRLDSPLTPLSTTSIRTTQSLPTPRQTQSKTQRAIKSEGSAPSTGSSKPTLLTPTQKKANHIQSEQKRRANIRRGYERLCETVPALREAIRLEEEEGRFVRGDSKEDDGYDGKKGKSKGKGKGKKMDEGGEKIDGRAGPRSENVVLGKTIEYMQELLSERASLLQRLNKARALLPPTPLPPPQYRQHQQQQLQYTNGLSQNEHTDPMGMYLGVNPGSENADMVVDYKPQLSPYGENGVNGHGPLDPSWIPLWEREWKGGEGHCGEDGEDDGEDGE